VSGSRSGSSNASSKRSAGASTADQGSPPKAVEATRAPALGPFSDPHALAVAAVSRVVPDTAFGSANSYQGVGAATSTTISAGTSNDSNQKLGSSANQPTTTPAAMSTNRAAGGGAACAAPPQLLLGAPVLRATATLSGKPVVVLVFAGAREHTVVVEDTSCRLLNVQMLS